jgi:DNA-binding CsgD family transcriptional regulator
VPRSDGPSPLILNAVALSARASRFVADQATVMLLIADPDARRRLDLDLLPALYGLTPAETRLARALLAGDGLRQAAAAAGMSYETGRWYLKILLQKTHTGRQAELVARLLADLGVAR